MEVGTGKDVQDPKVYAMARHECDISLLLLPLRFGVKSIILINQLLEGFCGSVPIYNLLYTVHLNLNFTH